MIDEVGRKVWSTVKEKVENVVLFRVNMFIMTMRIQMNIRKFSN